MHEWSRIALWRQQAVSLVHDELCSSRVVEGDRSEAAGHRLRRSSVDLLVRLMYDQGDVLVNIVRTMTQRVDSIEDKLLADRLGQRRLDLGALRRLLVRL